MFLQNGAYTKFSERLGGLIFEGAYIRRFTVGHARLRPHKTCFWRGLTVSGSYPKAAGPEKEESLIS